MEQKKHDRLAKVTDVCADDSEVLALSVARFVAAGYATGDVACWDTAYAGSERILGPRLGATVVATLTGVMRALRAERTVDWSFMPSTCCRVTADEEALVRLLALARQGDAAKVREAATRLAAAFAAPLTEGAAWVAAAALDAAATALLESTPPRRRTTVSFH